ncbi:MULTISPECIES: hypothetical protein [Cohnella]|uniref:Uncharacterized protein n=1 Tax=Cohnella rhizosphaerae TaxID=1457232 RepID=A0A9X4QS58_9BACL|nr:MULTISPECIES: hypothetical protein [Cohnella]MDG0808993.1 hypothetical protein [Cohnella rhizosphaerae]
MSTEDKLTIPQSELVQRWQSELQQHLHGGDQAEVRADEANPDGLLVQIRSAGRQNLEFDFSVRYVDSREIEIGLSDVERDGQAVDERSDVLQELIVDYRRHLHECAQTLQPYTHA